MPKLRYDLFFMLLQTLKKLLDFLYDSTTSTTLFKQCEIISSTKIDPPEIT